MWLIVWRGLWNGLRGWSCYWILVRAGAHMCAAHTHKMAVVIMVSAAFSGADSGAGTGSEISLTGKFLLLEKKDWRERSGGLENFTLWSRFWDFTLWSGFWDFTHWNGHRNFPHWSRLGKITHWKHCDYCNWQCCSP